MIKKSLALIMAAMIAMSFTACNSGSNGESSAESTNTSSSAESSVASETESKTTSNSESSTTSSETSSNSSETSQTNKYSISDLKIPDGCGPLLKPALQEFMNSMDSEKYLIKYSVEYLTESTNGKVVKGVNTVKRNGDKISSLMDAEDYDANLQIVKDNKVYEVDDSKKTVTWANVEDYLVDNFTVYTANIFYINTLELCGSGKETINGTEYDYEEYKEPESSSSASESSAESSGEASVERARYYFDSNGKLAGLKHTQGDYYYTTMIIELSQNVSDADFEYPSDYTLTERSELSEDSAASSTASSNSSN